MAEDGRRPVWERSFAIRLLGVLFKQKRPGAESALLRLTHAPGEQGPDLALHELLMEDPQQRFMNLYLEKALLGYASAFDGLSLRFDPSVAAFLNPLAQQPDPQSWNVRDLAQRALERLEILGAPDWKDRLQRQIEEPEVLAEGDRMPWAVMAARANALPGLAEMLRRRLDAGLQASRRAYEVRSRRKNEMSAPSGRSTPTFEEKYVLDGGGEALIDPSGDDLLILLWEMGGPLHDLERRRLREFGYACDPRERLLELLAADRPR